MGALGATSKPDKIHKAFDTLALLQAEITANGATYEWGSEFTVTDDPTPANNGDYKLTKGKTDNNKTNPANLALNIDIAPDSVQDFETYYIFENKLVSTTKFIQRQNVSASVSGAFSMFEFAQQDSIYDVEVTVMGLRPDGSAGYLKKMAAAFRRDGAADAVQVGATSNIIEVEDDAGTTATSSLSVLSNALRITFNTNDGVITYKWKLFVEYTYITV